jgi:protein-L-isoaspartate(D-aspartate) O-methyltransferase
MICEAPLAIDELEPVVKAIAVAASTVIAIVTTLSLTPTGAQTAAAQEFANERRRMVEDITTLVRETRAEVGKQPFDERVMAVMASVPRHEVVPASPVASAYRKRPLPIGHGQTISQPYIVALMTDLN